MRVQLLFSVVLSSYAFKIATVFSIIRGHDDDGRCVFCRPCRIRPPFPVVQIVGMFCGFLRQRERTESEACVHAQPILTDYVTSIQNRYY